MAQIMKGNYSALMWVQDELQKSLTTALQALQTYIDTNDNTALSNCVEQLYQANGTLQMLNLNGAQMLTAEMQALCQHLREPMLEDADNAKVTLLRSLLLLPNYLKLLNDEFPDHPLCLIESINSLREIRQQTPYQPLDLFQPLIPVNLPESMQPDPQRKPPTIDIAPQQLAAAYQRLLLSWLQKADDGSLRKMRGIFNYLRLASHQEKIVQLWWAAEALLEALLQRGLSIEADIKQVLGKLASPMKIVGEQGEDTLLTVFPETLLQQLLLIVARANNRGLLVSSLKHTYQLSFFDQQKAIYGISDNALDDAHAALLEELQKLKTQIDVFELSAPDATDILADIDQQLLNMADTLSLLNQPAGYELLQKQHQQLATLTEQTPQDANQTLTKLADSLLLLESQLRKHGSDRPGIDGAELQQAVVQECLFELGNIKENLTIAAQQDDISSELIASTCSGLQLITGSLEMLNLSAAADLLQSTVNKLQTPPFDEQLTAIAIQQLAEILSAAELYMESIQQHGHSPSQLIDYSRQILSQFGDVSTPEIVKVESETVEAAEVSPVSGSVNLTGVARYIAEHARYEISLTSVDLYIAKQAASAISSSDKPQTSVDLYLQQQAAIADGYSKAQDLNEAEASELSFPAKDIHHDSPIDDDKAAIDFSFEKDPVPESESHYELSINMDDMPPPAEMVETSIPPDWEDPLSISDALSEQLQVPTDPAGFAEGIDPEIAEVFLEEADEVLAELHQLIPNWQQEHNTQILGDIRRHFHTLKGSGRMAGAMAVGDLAWSIEDLLNRVLEGLNVDTEKLTELLLHTPSAVVDLVNRFSYGDMETSQTARQLAAQAELIREGLETNSLVAPENSSEPEKTTSSLPESDTQILTSVDQYLLKQAASSAESFNQPLTTVDLYLQQQAAKVAEQPSDIGNAIQTIADVDNSIDEDAELLDIFLSEARQHMLTLSEKGHSLHVGDCIDKSQLSAAHSLKGCANIAGVTPVALIATELDQTLKALHRQQHALNSDDLQLIRQIYQNLSHLVEIISDGIQDPDISILHQQLQRLQPEVGASDSEQVIAMDPEHLVSFLEETDALLDRYSRHLTEWQQTGEQTQQIVLHDTLHTLAENAQLAELPSLAALYQLLDGLIQHPQSSDPQIIDLLEQTYEMLNNQIEALIQNKSMADLTPLREDIAATLAALESLPADSAESTVISEPPPPQISPLADDDYDAVDPDLLSAFTEEAAELLSSSNEAVQLWQQVPNNDAAAMQLQRDLHTLKGGARLTGVTAIAELTHQIESLVIPVAEGQKPASEDFFDLLQRCQDQLSIMQEQLAERRPIMVNDSLLAEITAFGKGEQFVIESPPVETDAILPIEPTAPSLNPAEQIRVRADLLDYLSNFAGEVSISRDRVTQQHQALRQQLREMEETVSRLHEQLRKLEIETETQILFRYEDGNADHHAEFDPLELDRFSTIQQLSRSLTESVIDLNDISQSMDQMVRETDVILLQQSRLNTDLQQGLMRTRLVPFRFIVPRLERIVRQTSSEVGKHAELRVLGANQELDRAILDRLVAPVEHILRNAIAHGIESPSERQKNGKAETGQLQIDLQREGSEIVLSIRDDGQGLNIDKIRNKALALKLIAAEDNPSDEVLMQMILTSGFSTADNVSQLAGRGVGMDVVNNEIRALKGRLSIESVAGQGSCFHIRLPLTLSLIQALLVTANQQQFAIPLSTVKAGERLSVGDIRALLMNPQPIYRFDNDEYEFVPLSHLLGEPLNLPDNARQPMPLLLFRNGNVRVALLVDAINSNREIVIKSIGKQLSQINAINGATILGDGRVVLILDIPTLIEVHRKQHAGSTDLPEELSLQQHADEQLPVAMVVDDSITMRKASGSLLGRLGFKVMTAKDGIEALAQLYEQQPDIILLDVEMPRMDGFEFASIVRNDPQFHHLPIIMITSRTGDKHRQRALGIGVNDYLGKPYQENELVAAMKQLLGARYPHRRH